MINPTLLSYWPTIFFIFTALVHIAFSAAIYLDAKKQTQYEPSGSVFVGPFIWSLAVLFGGAFVAGLYWLIHHSALKRH